MNERTVKKMRNPWADLPETCPFVLPCDKQTIEDFNLHASASHKIHLEILPEPYAGNPEAPIILLNLNPRFAETLVPIYRHDDYFVQASQANRLHLPQAYPFYHLDPLLQSSAGGRYWRRIFKRLLAYYGVEKVAHNFCVIEYFPYHSTTFGHVPCVQSQDYSWCLVKEGVKRNAIIILMRSRKLWFCAVPELEGYQRYYEVSSPQNPVMSEPNCPKGFPEILKVLTHAYLHA